MNSSVNTTKSIRLASLVICAFMPLTSQAKGLNWVCGDGITDDPFCWHDGNFTGHTPLSGDSVFIDNGASVSVSPSHLGNPGFNLIDEYIGANDSGSVIQENADSTLSSRLLLGLNAGGQGSYRLNSGALSVNNYALIGNFGDGYVTQNGGNLTVSNHLQLGVEDGGHGEFTLNDGNLTAHDEVVGYHGSANFLQYGGSHSVTNEFVVGANSSGALIAPLQQEIGQYYIQNGNLTVGNELTVGRDGEGQFDQAGGTVNTVDMHVGKSAVATGSYSLNDGNLDVFGNQYLGNQGSGSITQSGGTQSIRGELHVGAASSGNGQFFLDGGDTSVYGISYVGSAGSGLIEQTGGTFLARRGTIIGDQSGSEGEVIIQDGVNQSYGTYSFGYPGVGLIVGSEGSGTLTQNGGSLTTDRHRTIIGGNAGSYGEFVLNDGSMTTGTLFVGHNGEGRIEQHGGSLDIPSYTIRHPFTGRYITRGGELSLGASSTGIGSFTLTAGSLNVERKIAVGGGGTATFTQTGGSITTDYLDIVGNADPTQNAFDLQGGLVEASTIAVGTRSGGTAPYSAQFTQSGGHVITNTLDVGSSSSSRTINGTYRLQGGTLQATRIDATPENVDSDALFELSGGVLSVNSFLGTLTNNGATLAPGDSPGRTSITEDFIQHSGVMQIEIDDVANDGIFHAGFDFDRFYIGGQATLGGSLEVSFWDGFLPQADGIFTFLTASEIVGTFDQLLFPAVDNLEFFVDYTSTTVDLHITRTNSAVPTPSVINLLLLIGLLGITKRKMSMKQGMHIKHSSFIHKWLKTGLLFVSAIIGTTAHAGPTTIIAGHGNPGEYHVDSAPIGGTLESIFTINDNASYLGFGSYHDGYQTTYVAGRQGTGEWVIDSYDETGAFQSAFHFTSAANYIGFGAYHDGNQLTYVAAHGTSGQWHIDVIDLQGNAISAITIFDTANYIGFGAIHDGTDVTYLAAHRSHVLWHVDTYDASGTYLGNTAYNDPASYLGFGGHAEKEPASVPSPGPFLLIVSTLYLLLNRYRKQTQSTL